MNYNIENGLNFYETLKQTIALHSSEKNEEEGLCPISNTPLELFFFTFECGHKFNYAPLFKDIYNHKKKYNNMEHGKGQLHMNEIRCPFCRKIQTGILPYYAELPFDKVHGVNYVNPDITEYAHVGTFKKCQFLIQDASNSENSEKCQSTGNVITSQFCFCYPHYIQHKNDEKKKIKAIKDAVKAEAKEASKAQKLASKAQKVAEKVAEKEAVKAQKVASKAQKLASKAQKVAEKEAVKAQKVAEKEAVKAQKVAEKEAK